MTRPATPRSGRAAGECGPAREYERIIAAYRHYDSDGAEQRKRDSSNPGTRLNGETRWAAIRRSLAGLDLGEGFALLDVGCGAGQDLQRVAREFAHLRPALHGIDLLPDRIDRARQAIPAGMFHVGGAERLPYSGGTFDVLLISTVLSSILDHEVARAVATEMSRVLAGVGTILCYDTRYPNPWNPHTRPIRARDLRGLFPGARLRLVPLTLLPPLARRLGAIAPSACRPLSAAPILRSHYLAEIRFRGRDECVTGGPSLAEEKVSDVRIGSE